MKFLKNKRNSHVLIGVLFMGIGTIHRFYPNFFEDLIPESLNQYQDQLGWLLSAVTFISGLGILFKQTRKIAKWPILVLLVVSLPNTINRYTHLNAEDLELLLPPFFVKLSLPIQILILVWVWWATKDDKKDKRKNKVKKR